MDAEHVKEDRTMGREIIKKNDLSPLHLIVELFSSFLEQKIYFLLSADEVTLNTIFTKIDMSQN